MRKNNSKTENREDIREKYVKLRLMFRIFHKKGVSIFEGGKSEYIWGICEIISDKE